MRHRPKNSELFRERARDMRHVPNDAESAVWDSLRDRKLRGFKFRRQHPLGNYIVDFFCAEANLVIELDGKTHIGKEADDAKRQAWLEAQGLLVMRFSNDDVREGLEPLLEVVWRKCVERSGQSPRSTAPHPNPLPGVPGRGSEP